MPNSANSTTNPVVFVTEKASVSVALFEAIQRLCPWPGRLVMFLPTNMAGLYRFKYPRNLNAQDFPYVGEPMLKPKTEQWDGNWPIMAGICGHAEMHEDCTYNAMNGLGVHFLSHSHITGLYRGFIPNEQAADGTLANLLDKAALIVKATDYYRGAVAFRDIMTLGRTRNVAAELLAKTRDSHIYCLEHRYMDALIGSLDDDTRPSLTGPWNIQGNQTLHGDAKEFMDWNWAFNASAILPAALSLSGLPSSSNKADKGIPNTVSLLSKYSILLAHAIERAEINSSSDHVLVHAMKTWTGTGRYSSQESSRYFNGMGSYASRATIIENMLKIGVLERLDDITYHVSYEMKQLTMYGYDPAFHTSMQAMVDSIQHGGATPSVNELVSWSTMLKIEDGEVMVVLPKWNEKFTPLDAGLLKVMNGNPEGMKQACRRFMMELATLLSENEKFDSPISIQGLQKVGVISIHRDGARLTARGKFFLDVLGKASYDPDLPMRLDAWCRQWPASKPAMQSYIQRWFGGVKRSLGMAALLENNDVRTSALLLVDTLGMDGAVKAAQVGCEVIRNALDGGEVSPGQSRGIGLAAQRLI